MGIEKADPFGIQRSACVAFYLSVFLDTGQCSGYFFRTILTWIFLITKKCDCRMENLQAVKKTLMHNNFIYSCVE